MHKILEIILTVGLFAVICIFYKDQKMNTVNGGKGYDGTEYYKTVEQYKQGKTVVTGVLPFIKRLGTPKIVAVYSDLTGESILKSALVVNLIAALLIVILNVYWLRLFVDEPWLRFLVNIIFMAGWANSLRYTFFYPMNSDAWATVLFLTGLILMQKLKNSFRIKSKIIFTFFLFLFCVNTAIGMFFREANAVLSLILPFVLQPIKRSHIDILLNYRFAHLFKELIKTYSNKSALSLFIPMLIAAIISLLITKLITVDSNGYSYFFTALSFLYRKSIIEYFLAIFIAYGPLIVLVLFNFRHFVIFFKNKQELLIVLAIAMILGFVGGSGSERILFNLSFPVCFILIAISIKNLLNTNKWWYLVILLVLQSLAYRIYWLTPDYSNDFKAKIFPFFTLLGDRFDFLLLFSNYGKDLINIVLFFQYIVLIFVTGWVIKKNKADV